MFKCDSPKIAVTTRLRTISMSILKNNKSVKMRLPIKFDLNVLHHSHAE